MTDRNTIRKAFTNIFNITRDLGDRDQHQLADWLGDELDVLIAHYGFTIEEAAFCQERT